MATRVRWLGHACLLFESGGRHVLIDPFLTGNPKAAAKADEVPAESGGLPGGNTAAGSPVGVPAYEVLLFNPGTLG